MGNRQLVSKSFAAVLAAAFSLAPVQAQKPTLEKQLETEYTLTTPTADNTDIVTMGSVLILQKKGLSAGAVSSKVVTQNTYKDGQIKSGAATVVRRLGGLSGFGIPGVSSAAGTASGAAGGSRDFVNGEKLYVTRITVDRGKNDILFDLISDAYGDAGRFKATLKIELPKGVLASEDLAKVDPTIAEVFKIAPADASAAAAPAAPAAPAPPPVAQAAPEPVLAPIAPPPPPPPDPVVETKSIEVGQTKAQVEAILGKPDKTAKVGTKEIYTYKDIKVTFVNGKMTDAQ